MQLTCRPLSSERGRWSCRLRFWGCRVADDTPLIQYLCFLLSNPSILLTRLYLVTIFASFGPPPVLTISVGVDPLIPVGLYRFVIGLCTAAMRLVRVAWVYVSPLPRLLSFSEMRPLVSTQTLFLHTPQPFQFIRFGLSMTIMMAVL